MLLRASLQHIKYWCQMGQTNKRTIPIVFDRPLALVKEFMNPPTRMCSCRLAANNTQRQGILTVTCQPSCLLWCLQINQGLPPSEESKHLEVQANLPLQSQSINRQNFISFRMEKSEKGWITDFRDFRTYQFPQNLSHVCKF